LNGNTNEMSISPSAIVGRPEMARRKRRRSEPARARTPEQAAALDKAMADLIEDIRRRCRKI